MIGESKFDVLSLVPDAVKPETILVAVPSTPDAVVRLIETHGLRLPVVFKPDLGERGWMVRIIRTHADIVKYLSEIRINFIIQELVDLPFEFGVFYLRFPDRDVGVVNSITMKEFLSVVGDGKSTLQQLILSKDRAKLQWETLRLTYYDELDLVLSQGEKKELVPIGNHCLGTTFLNANHLITQALNESFDRLSKQIKGFYFGRYDLRCASLEDLEEGRVMIMELNGCGAEPAHIYQPGFPIFKAFGVLFTHWKNMYSVSRQNHARGVPYISGKEMAFFYRRFKDAKSTQ